jgi:DHA2 family multidrug resistance protein-like MFS transporter
LPSDGLTGRHRTWAIVALSLGVGMSGLETSIANTALPAMAAQLHATPAASVWIVNAYQLAMVATVLPVSALGETLGYRRIYVAGMALFALGDAAHRVAPQVVLPEAAGALACLALLLRRQRGHPAPLLPVDLLRRPLFALSTLTAVCTFAAQALAFVALPFYFETTLGRSPVETGFLMTPWPVLVGIMAPVAGRLSDRYAPGLLGGIGLLVLTAGLLALWWLPASPSVLDIGWRMAVCGIGFGFFQAPNMKAIMGSAPPSRGGSASGMVATARLTGQSLGAALVALCLTISHVRGPAHALALGAGFALFASAASFARLAVGVPKAC